MKSSKEIAKIQHRNARLMDHKSDVENRSFRRSSHFRGIVKAMRRNSLALLAKVRGEIQPIIDREVQAWQAWERKLGRPYGVTVSHDGMAYVAHTGGTAADVELSDTDRALVSNVTTGNEIQH